MTTTHTIRVQGLEKSYGDLEVLRGVDLDVARGSIFALLGSNGAGKTTLVKILSTLLKADAGTAGVDGFDVAAQPATCGTSISLTGQFAAVDEILSGRENLVLVARLRHLDGPGHDRRRPARPLLADRRGGAEGGDVLRRHAPPARHRDEPDREPAGDLPRRADDRARPAGAHRGVAGRPGARPTAARRCCSPPSTSTRPNSSPTGSRSSTRAGSSPTARSPSSSGSCRRPRSSTSRSSRPSRTSSSRSSAATARQAPTHADRSPSTRRSTMTTHSLGDTAVLTGPVPAPRHAQPRHHHHHRDHADRHHADVRVRVRRRDRHGRRQLRRTTCCPGSC